jgi:iron complex transport system substrate-binding protein
MVGCEARAHALTETMQQGFNDTKRKAAIFFRKPKIYIEEWHNPPMVSGNWVPELIKLAGGIPMPLSAAQKEIATDGKNVPSAAVTLAEVQAFDPDLIVLSICGAGNAASKELLSARPGWADLRAVRENHLFVIDDSLLNRPGPRLAEGAKRLFGWMFQVLH